MQYVIMYDMRAVCPFRTAAHMPFSLQIAADICFQMAELRRQQEEISNAVRDYQEALQHDDTNAKVSFLLFSSFSTLLHPLT